jgi:hypothetical protein
MVAARVQTVWKWWWTLSAQRAFTEPPLHCSSLPSRPHVLFLAWYMDAHKAKGTNVEAKAPLWLWMDPLCIHVYKEFGERRRRGPFPHLKIKAPRAKRNYVSRQTHGYHSSAFTPNCCAIHCKYVQTAFLHTFNVFFAKPRLIYNSIHKDFLQN